MFETHFGFSGPPFQLNADPTFFFGSRGHSHALAYMRFGVHQAEGFIVVTGEVGAGKTTLVRTLMASLEQERVVAAQVVSTQLEAGDLLRAILAAFGVSAPANASKAQLISSLEAFLTALAAQGRRALLVIDEAQNLDRAAVEELRMLSNFQLGTHGLLQSFLVGQPELRKLLQSRSMEQLRQRVIASCHLGPLDEGETRAYIEHRLTVVGWKAHPGFDDEAFARIHGWTGGIPRRINRLCSRLLLGAYLSGSDQISANDVEQTAQELGDEIGEAEPATGSASAATTAAVPPREGLPEASNIGARPPSHAGGELQSAVFCWVDTTADYLKAGVLAQAMAKIPAMPRLVAVQGGSLDRLLDSLDDDGRLPRPDAEVGLDVTEREEPSARYVVLLTRFAALMDQYRPSALIMLGASDDALMCAVFAQKSGLPLVRADAGRAQRAFVESVQLNASVLDRVADMLYVDTLVSYHALHKAGVAAAKLQCVGDLSVDVLYRAQDRLSTVEDVLRRLGPLAPRLQQGRGFGLVYLHADPGHVTPEDVEATIAAIVPAAADITLLWMVDDSLQGSPSLAKAEQQWRSALVRFMPAPGHLELLSLLREADLLITTHPRSLVEEAGAMSVPTLLVGPEGVLPIKGGDVETARSWQAVSDLARLATELRAPRDGRLDRLQAWDGGSAPRISAHLQTWLAGRVKTGVRAGGVREPLRSTRP